MLCFLEKGFYFIPYVLLTFEANQKMNNNPREDRVDPENFYGNFPLTPIPPKVDLTLLRVLQSMGEMEKNYDFRSKNYVISEKDETTDKANGRAGDRPAATVFPRAFQHKTAVHKIPPNFSGNPKDLDPKTAVWVNDYEDDDGVAAGVKGWPRLSTTDDAGASVVGEHAADIDATFPTTETVAVKYPDNVIVVASPTGRAPPPAEGETRVHTILAAVQLAARRCEQGGYRHSRCKGVSIVVHEGIYIDPTRTPTEFENGYVFGVVFPNTKFKVELVGVNNVRIINLRDGIFVNRMHLTVKNVSVYHRRLTCPAAFHAVSGQLTLVAVRINAMKVVGVFLGLASQACLFDCALAGGLTSCIIGDHSVMRFYGCRITDMSQTCSILMKSTFTAVDTIFLRARGVANNSGIGHFLRCEIRGEWNEDESLNNERMEDIAMAMTVTNGARVTVTDTRISNFRIPIELADPKSAIMVDRSKIVDCIFGIVARVNSNAKICDCVLGVKIALRMNNNDNGVVIFERNEWLETVLGTGIMLDPISKKPQHDFEDVVWLKDDPKPLANVSSKKRSMLTGQRQVAMRDMLAEGERTGGMPTIAEIKNVLDHDLYKSCSFCHALECMNFPAERTVKAGIKFKFCSKCEIVCYCSKECQIAHWKSHRLVCKKEKKSKTKTDDETEDELVLD